MNIQYYARICVSVIGINIVYLSYGIVQERIYKYVSSEGLSFKFTTVLLLLQCLINLIVAFICSIFIGKPQRVFSSETPKVDLVGRAVILNNHGREENCIIQDVTYDGVSTRISFTLKSGETLDRIIRDHDDICFVRDSLKHYWIYGVCYTLAMLFSNASLRHVNYPTQVLAKSCKMIPVLVAGTLYKTRTYSVQKYISVFITTAGIILFQMMAPQKLNKGSNSTLGLILLGLSLCMDGVCGVQQDIVVPRYKPSPMRLQIMLNTFGLVVSLCASVVMGELESGVLYLIANHTCLWYAIQFGLFSSVGQLFVLYTVRHFPPLVLATITTTRKFFSILVSVVFMGNEMNLYQWVGVVLVFIGISYDNFQGIKKKSHGN